MFYRFLSLAASSSPSSLHDLPEERSQGGSGSQFCCLLVLLGRHRDRSHKRLTATPDDVDSTYDQLDCIRSQSFESRIHMFLPSTKPSLFSTSRFHHHHRLRLETPRCHPQSILHPTNSRSPCSCLTSGGILPDKCAPSSSGAFATPTKFHALVMCHPYSLWR